MLDLNWPQIVDHLWRILVAFALAFPLGWERGGGRDSVGYRTLPIVAMASCGFALTAASFQGANAESLTRLLQGLMSGIGFIGGGAILKHNGSVHGVATAASIWNVGAIGVAVAFDRIEVALVLSAVNLLALLLLTPLAKADESEP